MIKNGRQKPGSGKEWEKQIKLSKKMTIELIKNFHKEGFTVLSDEIISTKKILDEFYSKLKKYKPKFFLLIPNKEVLKKRDLERGKNALKERALYLHEKFSELSKKEKRLIIIDSSNHSPKETANKIMEKIK
jgi:thymidylate kinase